jgi:hypothetical protein
MMIGSSAVKIPKLQDILSGFCWAFQGMRTRESRNAKLGRYTLTSQCS